jgi:hypothetical protein
MDAPGSSDWLNHPPRPEPISAAKVIGVLAVSSHLESQAHEPISKREARDTLGCPWMAAMGRASREDRLDISTRAVWHTTGVLIIQLVALGCIVGMRLAAFGALLQWWTAPGQNTLQVP